MWHETRVFYYRDKLENTISKYKMRWKMMHAFRRQNGLLVYVDPQIMNVGSISSNYKRLNRWQLFETRCTLKKLSVPIIKLLPLYADVDFDLNISTLLSLFLTVCIGLRCIPTCHVHFHSLEVARSLFARWRECVPSNVCVSAWRVLTH